MLEASRVGGAESDEEIELSLELSIGGRYEKAEKLKQVKDLSDKENETGVEVIAPRSGFLFSETLGGDQAGTESWSGLEVVDSKRKREIQALRRQEAQRKREEKLRKSAVISRGVNGDNSCFGVAIANDKAWLEAQHLKTMVRYRKLREDDNLPEESARKKEKISNHFANEAVKDDETGSRNNGSARKGGNSSVPNVAGMEMRGTHPNLQCLPLINGVVYPYLSPCSGPNVGKEESEMKERMVMACGTMRAYLNGNGISEHDLEVGCDSEDNISKAGRRNQKAMPSGYLERTSSAFSDHRSSSGKGGSSSGTGCYSSHLQASERQPSVSATSNRLDRFESNGSAALKELLGQIKKRSTDSGLNGGLQTESQDGAVVSAGNMKPEAQPTETANNPTSALQEQSPLKQTRWSGGSRKLQARNHGTPSLPRMPCVSTTGNGPNGKTITGFLYSYTRSEVSIVCVCHGSSFSPAEFVEHAGGIDITHPLRHITMIPSSFG